ncbi:MAG: tautomerase family protein [Bacillota bacterium]|nr:tautomerase family protein [Bacillota bacterium]
MPQMKVHLSKSMSSADKLDMVKTLRGLMPQIMGIDEKLGQAMLYEADFRANHESKDKNFVFIEITLYKGRSYEIKKKLADAILDVVSRYTGVDKADINIVYYEMDPHEAYFGGSGLK